MDRLEGQTPKKVFRKFGQFRKKPYWGNHFFGPKRYHHSTMLFLFEQREKSPDYPLLSSNDIVELFNNILDRKASERRQKVIVSAYSKQMIQDLLYPD
jgi:hypothetical protein